MSKREDAEEDKVEFHFNCSALVDDDVDFPDLPLKDRVLILQQVKILARFTIVEYLVFLNLKKVLSQTEIYSSKKVDT